MTGWRKRIRWMPRMWLLTALLATQSLVLAHGVEHAIDADTSLCAICSLSHGLEKAVVTTDAPVLAEPAPLPPEPQNCPSRSPETRIFCPTRGPPATL